MSLPIFQRTIVDSSGNIQPGASVAVRNETTGDLVTIYADREGGTAKANPFLADSEGFATFYVEPGEYQVTATTPTGTITWSHVAIGDTALLQLAQPTGDALVGSDDGAGGSLWTTVAGFIEHTQEKLVTVKDYGASAGAPAASNTVAFNAALVAAGARKCAVYVPGAASAYLINDTLTVPDGVTIYGDGWGSLIQQTALNKGVFVAGNSNTFRTLRAKVIDGDGPGFVNCVYAVGVNNLTVENCFLESADNGGCGVHMRGVKNSTIRGNRIYGGKWTGGVNGASAADILLYSFGTSERHVIEGNFCLSNNSQGIYADALGFDGDLIIKGNVCVTLDPATCTENGTWSLVATGGVRRHGIVVGYNGSSVSGPRCIVDSNICRNTRWTGIYKQGVSTGAVIISNNICDLNGYETGVSLGGGIFIQQSGLELVVNNTVTNYQNTISGDTGGITVTSTLAITKPSEVVRNKIIDSAGYGIVLKAQAALVTVEGNSITGSENADISCIPSPSVSTVGGHRLLGNIVTRTKSTLRPCISINPQASTRYTLVSGNILRGNDNTTNDTQNAAIRRIGADALIRITENDISNFYYGVLGANYWAGGRLFDAQFERNTFTDCNSGFALGATSGVQTVPLVDNRFINVTTPSAAALGGNAAGRIVQRMGSRLQWETTAEPTLGTWAVGDRSDNTAPAVGQPKSWVCTVAGAPGTWVSEGNL